MPKIYEIDTDHPLVIDPLFNLYKMVYCPSNTELLLKETKANSELERLNLIQEIHDLLLLRGCPTIYKLCQCIVIDKYNLILEYCERKTLEDYIKSLHGKQMDPQLIGKFGYSLAKSIYDIHKYELKIGRISPDTLYLCSERGSSGEKVLNVKYAGYSIAQDIIGRKAFKDSKDTSEHIYRFGEVIYFMLFGTVEGYEKCETLYKPSSLVSKDLQDAFSLVKKCVNKKYYRLSQILNDPYLKSYS